MLAALMVLAASPTMAQVAAEFGPVVASVDDWQNARIGLYGGVSLDLRDCFSIAALYVQRGQDCCLRHSIEMPVTYRHRLDEVAYAIAGVAPSYAGEYSDVGVLAGLGTGRNWLLPAQSPVLRSRPFDMVPTVLTTVQGRTRRRGRMRHGRRGVTGRRRRP